MNEETHVRILISKLESELGKLVDINMKLIAFHESRGEEPKDELELRLYGSFLHDFYTCVERIMREIAAGIDGEVPQGESWHSDLLEQMALEIPGVRMAILSTTTKEELHEFLRFRHVFRNVYGFELNWDKIKTLMDKYSTVYYNVESSIHELIAFLSKIMQE
ncbi:MAG TPA: hypothetical protein VKM55_22195 [Candidatus Lokiarchaeia archaeon]|nr:hypothetical protein [Candidatus Lokiarchaeia archaeon]